MKKRAIFKVVRNSRRLDEPRMRRTTSLRHSELQSTRLDFNTGYIQLDALNSASGSELWKKDGSENCHV